MVGDSVKLAAYLDEAGEDPALACSTLRELRLPYVVLRHVWAHNICDITDHNCQRLKEMLDRHDLTVIGIITDLGKVSADRLLDTPKVRIDRVFNLATYYGARYLRIYVGTKCGTDASGTISDWMAMITERCLAASLVPLLEITDDAYLASPAEVATFMARFRRWRLLYDPVQLILKRHQDPFTKYWTLLKSFVAAIDVRDLRVGHGFRPAGFGNSKIDLTITDAIRSNFDGWLFLEPSLGRRHGSAYGKKETFKLALEALNALLV